MLRCRETQAISAAIVAWAGLVAGTALATESGWRAGADLGLAVFAAEGGLVGPIGGGHLAYGVTDFFDLELAISGTTQSANAGRIGWLAAELLADFRLDLLQWVPHAAIGFGYARFFGATPSLLAEDQPMTGLHLGIDYLATRSLTLGAVIAHHGFLGAPLKSWVDAPLITMMLRVEGRWGF